MRCQDCGVLHDGGHLCRDKGPSVDWRARAEQAEAELAECCRAMAQIIWKGANDNYEWQKRAGLAWKARNEARLELEWLRTGIRELSRTHGSLRGRLSLLLLEKPE